MSIAVGPLAHTQLDAGRAVLAAALGPDAAAVAEEKLFGDAVAGRAMTLAARGDDGQIAGVAVACGQWIRLLAVAPAQRGRGLGSALLRAAEQVCRDVGAARTLDQPGNYLTPGVPAEDTGAIAWLERRGYVPVAERTNLIIDLRDNARVGEAQSLSAAARSGYVVRRVSELDRQPFAAWVERSFSPGWAFEAARGCAHVAVDAAGDYAGFANHDGNNRGLGWFGPAGTLAAHRGHGVGAALLLACLVDVAAAGHGRCTVAWIGPRAFYERVAGVAGERRFVVLEKELS